MTKVSIIIPCYNKGKYVTEAIISAINQTFQNIEIICVNDASTDDSDHIITQLADKYKNILYFKNKENKGVCYTRNSAIQAASGDFILPLDADDTIEPTYVEKAVKVLEENPNIGVVYCRARYFGTKNEIWESVNFKSKEDMLYLNRIFCSAMFRKSDFIRVGKYNANMQNGNEDHDLWLSFIEHGFDVYQINEVLFNYRKYDETSRSDLVKKNPEEFFNQIIKNHINLYLQNKQFGIRVFTYENLKEQKKKEEQKKKKYKKLFNIMLPVTIIEFIFLIILIIILCIVVN